MSGSRQEESVRRIEEALLALRLGAGRGGPRPPWGDGPPPWVGGRGRGPFGRGPFGPGMAEHLEHHDGHPGARGHGRGMLGGARVRLLEFLEGVTADARIGISEVAESIGVDQPRASRLVADAVSRGLVSRDTDPRDARKSVLTITGAGRTLLDQIRSGRRSAVTEALADFTDDEAAQFAEYLSRFAAAWRR